MAKIEVNNDSLIFILNETYQNIQEERALALDRYKLQDENLDSDEQFALQGKTLCDLLKIAADRSNTLLQMGRMIAGILYKDTSLQQSSGLSEEDIKDAVKREVQREINDIDMPGLDETVK